MVKKNRRMYDMRYELSVDKSHHWQEEGRKHDAPLVVAAVEWLDGRMQIQ